MTTDQGVLKIRPFQMPVGGYIGFWSVDFEAESPPQKTGTHPRGSRAHEKKLVELPTLKR